jgi:hypothetical protein
MDPRVIDAMLPFMTDQVRGAAELVLAAHASCGSRAELSCHTL